ncbi:MAG: aldo/keto reductase [Gemmatimonadetes bacterium]|nr:aldo/keto reductase [Gemmatimonadota bacterium]
MRQVPLGDTGLKVSELCLGTMTFGKESDEATSGAVYRRCREAGIDFFDCANVYVDGVSEEILGSLVAGERDQVVLTSKVYFKKGEGPLARGYSRAAIMHHVEGSLKRLGTDWLDLYFLHHFDEDTPIEDALRALDDLVTQGKIRYPAVSNFAAWQIERALGISAREGLAAFRCVQPMYNLLKRQAEVEILPMARAEGLGVISYSPLAGGLLTGKYGKRKSPDVEGRLNVSQMYQKRYAQPSDFEVAQDLVGIAETHGYHPVSLAVAWVAKHPAVTAPIIGARSLEQLEPSLASVDVDMTDELYAGISSLTPAPALATDREEERAG